MKVFLAGATGVIGHRTLRLLVGEGHDVSAVARSAEKAQLVRSLGGRPVMVDLFDPAAVAAAVAGHEVAVNLATHIPPLSRSPLPRAWAENVRIRREASANLAAALLETGGQRFVQESITFPYADGGDRWLDEDAAIDAPTMVSSTQEAEGQAARVTGAGATGVVLRFAQFYAPDSSHSRAFVKAVRRRVAPVLGDPDGYTSSIHADDAAAAVVAALAAPAGIYNVADDEPLTRRGYAEAVAAAVGVKPPHFAPAGLAKIGGASGGMLARSQRIANGRFKAATGWAPRFPDARIGWVSVAAELSEGERAGA